MKNKPQVFLSHSKTDKKFIETIAHDLQKCRIDAWYDDWEIPPGKSLRKKIFEEAIPNCDAFFVYLSPDSISSNWVNRELDAAFIEQSKEKNTEILTFVSNSDLIKKLPSEIASMKCPAINNENYEEGLKILITAIYEAKVNSVLKQRNLEHENKILQLEMELERKNIKLLEVTKGIDFTLEEIKTSLEKSNITVDKKTINSLELFIRIWPFLVKGTFLSDMQVDIKEIFDVKKERYFGDEEIRKLLSPYLIHDLVEMKPFKAYEMGITSGAIERIYDKFSLTETGKGFVKLLTKGISSINIETLTSKF